MDLEQIYENILAPAKQPKDVINHYAKNAYGALSSALISLQQISDHLNRLPDTKELQDKTHAQEEQVKTIQLELENYILRYFK